MNTTALTGLPHSIGAQFQAKFDSNCPGCDLAIYEGDLMGYVDDVAVCDGCYNEADQANHEALRDQIKVQREAERAEDPEKFDRQQAAVKEWVDKVMASAAENPGKEWVPAPTNTPGWVRVPPGTEPTSEQDSTVSTETIEPGIQALMAAGLLQGQEPGGDGVCHATIEVSGKVTEVAIPVPVAQPAVPSADTAGDPGVAVESLTTPVSPAEGSAYKAAVHADARRAQLAANARDWDPAAIEADVKAAQLQAGLQSAVDSGAMSVQQATALGWIDPEPVQCLHCGAASSAHDSGGVCPDGADPADPYAPEAASPWVDPVTGTNFCPAPGCSWAVHDGPHQGAPSPSAGLVLGALSAAATVAEEDAILTALDALPPYVGGFDHDTAKKEILGILQEAINYHPRSLQKQIGPSEIGTECDHCLAAKLAGWEQVDRDAWLPTVGTAVHSWIESAFGRIHEGPGGSRRFLTERKVSVGEIDGMDITGSTDLVDVVLGCTWDWKIVGPTTLKSAKTGPSRRYVVQQMLYGRGWNRLGVKVTRVGIAYLPRNAMSLNAGVWWSAEYDEEIAVTALERASGFARNIRALETLGKDAVDAYVTGLPRWREWTPEGLTTKFQGNAQEGQIICMDCPRYGDYPADPAKALAQLDGLL